MAKNKRIAERRRRKALKRAQRGRRRTDAGPTRPPEDALALMRDKRDSLLDEWEADENCSSATAANLAEACAEIAGTLTMRAEDARAERDDWPDDERTRDLRALLTELAAEAERDAAKWAALESRLDALAGRADRHVHLEDGELVAADRDREPTTVINIPY